MSNRSPKKIAVWLVVIVFVLGIASYVYFRSRALINGPQITITEPESGTTFYSPLITISGKTKNTSVITLNEQPIFVTSEGNFKEQLVLSPGYNIIALYGEDRFGKTDSATLELYLESEPDSIIPEPVVEVSLQVTDATSVEENAQIEEENN